MSQNDLLFRTVPKALQQTLTDIGTKLGVRGPTLAAAVLAWDALATLPVAEQRKALAVLMGLSMRDEK